MPVVAAALHPASGSWVIASDLPGRLRVRQSALRHSPPLRGHCLAVLRDCRWLLQVRLNALAGSLCITYPCDRRDEITALLHQALQLPALDETLAPALTPTVASRQLQRTLLHGGACAGLLALESLAGLPALLLGAATTLLLWPLAREVVEQLRRRQLTVDSLELGFSSLLVNQGLAAEALLDLAIGDAVQTAQNTIHRNDLQLDRDHMLDRLARAVELDGLNPDGSPHRRLLSEATAGLAITLSHGQHCWLAARLTSGELLVSCRLVDGDWRPLRLTIGDVIRPGALVICGSAVATIEHGIDADPDYHLLREHHACPAAPPSDAERWMDRYRRLMPPLQLGLGGVLLLLGSGEQALAALQFNPINDWERHSLAARLTAIADLRLHRLAIRHPEAIETLGTIRHLVISRSSLDHSGGLQVRERIGPGRPVASGFLVQVLAGIQRCLCGVEGAGLWSRQLEQVAHPVAVRRVVLDDLRDGWQVEADDGRRWRLRQVDAAGSAHHPLQAAGLELWQEDCLLGTLELIRAAEPHWPETARLLRELEIHLHVIAGEPVEQLAAIGTALGVPGDHLHGSCAARERLALVQQLQAQGEAVGFIGSVRQDLPALAQADVSIGLEIDVANRCLSGLCDLSLNAASGWLPVLIRTSRELSRVRQQNLGLLAASQLASSLATAAGLIAPLQMVLLTDLPLLLAELNHLMAQTRTAALR